jgi:hypothetical protein
MIHSEETSATVLLGATLGNSQDKAQNEMHGSQGTASFDHEHHSNSRPVPKIEEEFALGRRLFPQLLPCT